jgi:cell shape-determining protein MreC
MFSDEGGYFEIIIYVLAMVVGLVANAYRNYSKKKQKESREFGQGNSGFPNEVFDTDYPEDIPQQRQNTPSLETVQEREIIKSKEENQKVPDLTESYEAVEEKPSDEVISDEEDDITKTIYMEESDEDSVSFGEITDYVEDKCIHRNFDLEKAVIYSEILRAKYINNNY